MRRVHLFEFEDQAWFPDSIRDAMTGFLTIAGRIAGHGRAIAPILARLLEESRERRIVDLCSGSGGPIFDAVESLEADGVEIDVTFTDLYPNEPAAARIGSAPNRRFERASVDATRVPKHLRGVRTLANAFHHFPPDRAREVLRSAAEDRAPIAIFEFVGRHPLLLAAILFAPINALLLVPFIRPFRWIWIPLTYLIPVIPLLILWDGWVSSFRVYGEAELLELADGLADPADYRFRVEEFRIAPLPVTFRALVGVAA